MRRIIFVAAILGRIMRRRDDDTIGKAARPALVVAEDRMRDDRRRRIAAALVDHDVDAVGGKHLDRARQRRLGQRMGIDADEQRPGQAGFAAMIADRLRRRQDMVFVERVFQRRPAMPRGAEGHALGGIGRIRLCGEIGRHQSRDVDERSRIDWFASSRIRGSHGASHERMSEAPLYTRKEPGQQNCPTPAGGQRPHRVVSCCREPARPTITTRKHKCSRSAAIRS